MPIKKSQIFLNTWIEECDLINVWRQMYPTMKRYAYHQLRPTKVFTRIDFMSLSLGLTGFVNNSAIKPGLCTDHSQISLTLSMQNTTRNPGFWKFNSSQLHNIGYVNLVKEVITETVAINKEASHQLLWDTVKDQIRGNTIRYISIKKKPMKRQKDLEEKLNVLENVRENENNINEILHTKKYLN